MPKINHQKKLSYLLLISFLSSFFYWISIATQNSEKPTTTTQTNAPQSESISGIARVIDGDTIEINKNRIRLIKIDAPETKQKCLDKNYFEYLCGEVSTTFLKKLINNKNVECFYEEKDMYSRYLGDCRFGEIKINYWMVQNGMAIIYNLKDADDELKNLELAAKNKKLGVWQGAFEEPKQWRRKHKRKN